MWKYIVNNVNKVVMGGKPINIGLPQSDIVPTYPHQNLLTILKKPLFIRLKYNPLYSHP